MSSRVLNLNCKKLAFAFERLSKDYDKRWSRSLDSYTVKLTLPFRFCFFSLVQDHGVRSFYFPEQDRDLAETIPSCHSSLKARKHVSRNIFLLSA